MLVAFGIGFLLGVMTGITIVALCVASGNWRDDD